MVRSWAERALRDDAPAEAYPNTEVNDAMVMVPAHFNDSQCEVTMDAALGGEDFDNRIAGFCLRQLALGLLNRMAEAKVEAETICYSAAIGACEKRQEWQLALGLLSWMAEAK